MGGEQKEPFEQLVKSYYLSFNDKKKNPTVDVVEVKLAAKHEKGAKGQAETERSRQVTVTYARVQCVVQVLRILQILVRIRIHTSD